MIADRKVSKSLQTIIIQGVAKWHLCKVKFFTTTFVILKVVLSTFLHIFSHTVNIFISERPTGHVLFYLKTVSKFFVQ